MYGGLSSQEAESKLKEYGANEIEEKESNPIIQFLRWFVKPTSLMMEVALMLSFLAKRIEDAYVILSLLLINIIISFYHEYKAENVIEKLKEKLAIKTKVIRDWKEIKIDSRLVVPGDAIILEKGDIVPADCKILEAAGMALDESMLTGESFPKEKKAGDALYSTSIVKAGKCTCEITATGKNTYFGKTIKLIASGHKESVLEKDVIMITKFLIAAGLISMVILAAYFLYFSKPVLEILTLIISIAIASFPIALPTVITLVTSLGVYSLSKKDVVVRRLASLEDLSNVNLLLSDKTGTLTTNDISVADVYPYTGTKGFVMKLAYACSDESADDVIDSAIVSKAKSMDLKRDFRITKYLPATPESKMSLSTAFFGKKKFSIAKGEPDTIAKLCSLSKAEKERMEKNVRKFSEDGYKIIAVAHKAGKSFRPAGLLLLLNPPRNDAGSAVRFLKDNQITTKMVTGDNRFIANMISKIIGIGDRTISRNEIKNYDAATVENYDSFSGLFPEDKYKLVIASRPKYVCAVTGDGVNDIPAIKEANVGIAVSTATDATKNSADVVLLSPGISVITDALIESRIIFEKIYYYTIYRISESFRLIMTILLISLLIGSYPLTPLQIIFLSLLNDIPIISIAFDRVKISSTPSKIDFKKRTSLGVILGMVGVVNSIIFLWLALEYFHLNLGQLQTLFFLKLSLGGHFLLLVARAKERWYKFMPSKILLASVLGTQLIASLFAYFGIIMQQVSLSMIAFVWLYAFFWMQVSDAAKIFSKDY
ncbi:Copper-exporting P-type ATPase B [uncultured archaeon]|nr:Copper-exporting P-type ATPase B [uncultured archaeon]